MAKAHGLITYTVQGVFLSLTILYLRGVLQAFSSSFHITDRRMGR